MKFIEFFPAMLNDGVCVSFPEWRDNSSYTKENQFNRIIFCHNGFMMEYSEFLEMNPATGEFKKRAYIDPLYTDTDRHAETQEDGWFVVPKPKCLEGFNINQWVKDGFLKLDEDGYLIEE
jgi:hypothetical protein